MMKQWKRFIALASVFALCITVTPVQAVGTNRQNVVVDGGMSHSIILTDKDTVQVCGSNQEYQLGIPDKEQITAPQTVEGLDNVVSVAAGYNFSAALKYNGTVYTWGGGQQETPTAVNELSNVVAIAAGQMDILALAGDGTVWQWSVGGKPAQVSGLRDIVAIDAGGSHFLALTTNGEVYAWGGNWSGQLGNGTTQDSTKPQKLNGLFNIIDIAAGYSHSLAIGSNGTVYAWGSNGYGQLGDGTTEDSSEPVVVKSIKNAAQVAAGTDCSLALTKDKKIYSWGYGEYGQLGINGAVISQTSPKIISLPSGSVPIGIACGTYHCLFTSESGAVYAWGRNKNYQLGTKKNVNAETPQRITATVADAGMYHTNSLDSVSSWAREEVGVLYDKGVVPPLLWNSYQGNITRAEFAHLLVSLYQDLRNSTLSATNNQGKFKDIQDHPLKDDIVRAYNLKLISGTSGTTFSPDKPLTRQEAAKMLCTFLNVVEGANVPTKVSSMTYYKDAAEISDWAAPYVAYCYQNNIMKGSSADTFSPTTNLSREQGLLIVSRLTEKYDWF